MTKQRILVVGDDTGLRATLARWLIAAGYSVELAESARHARRVLVNEKIALAIVVPERLDSGRLACELRTAVDRLILMREPADNPGLSTAPAVHADGYLARPLREDDVLAQIDAVLRRSRTGADAAEIGAELLHFGGYTVDAASRTCFDAGGQVTTLTRAELALVLTLARRLGRVVSRDDLSHAVAGRGVEPGDRSVDVLISRLRRKIEADPKSPRVIVTVTGAGYMLAAKTQMATSAAPAADATATDTAATESPRSRQRPQLCRIHRAATPPSAPKRWRVSPVSRTSISKNSNQP